MSVGPLQKGQKNRLGPDLKGLRTFLVRSEDGESTLAEVLHVVAYETTSSAIYYSKQQNQSQKLVDDIQIPYVAKTSPEEFGILFERCAIINGLSGRESKSQKPNV